MKIYKLIPLLLFITSNVFAATYTGTKPMDLNLTTPTESNTKISEFNNSDREIKTVITNLENLTTVTGTYTVTGTQTGILGSSTSGFTISFPSASSVATGTITKKFWIKNINTGTITLNLNIDGVGSPTVTGSQTFRLFTNGTSWFEDRANTAAVASNALLLNGLPDTYYTNATNLATGTVNLNRIPGTLTGKDADTLDGYNPGTITNTLLILDGSGLVPLANIPTTLTGKNADLFDNYNNTDFVKTTDSYVSSFTAGSGISTTGATGSITVTNIGVTNVAVGSGLSTTGATGAITLANTGLTNVTAGSGVSTTGATGSITVTNTGVRGLIAGSAIIIDQSTGSVTVTNNGVQQILAGSGISITSNGTGTPTITASGTSSAGGWTDTGTQTLGTLGLRVVPQGTIAVHASYGIVGLLDEWIPNTLTLDNIMQITTRNLSDMQGSLTATQIPIYNDISGTNTLKPTLISIGTTTTRGALNAVGSATFSGSVTAASFIVNDIELTNTWAGISGNPTDNGSASVTGASGKFPIGSTTNKLDPSWMADNLLLYPTTTLGVGTFGQIYIGTGTAAYNVSGSSTAPPTLAYADSQTNGTGGAAFDGILGASNQWETGNTAHPHYLIADYGTGTTKKIDYVRIYGTSNETYSFQIQASQDASSWSTLYTGTYTTQSGGVWEYFNFSNNTAYRFYRYYQTQNWISGNYAGMQEMEYFNQAVDSTYTTYSYRYVAPGDGFPVLSMTTTGTATTQRTFFLVTASTTVFGLGTTTAVTGTSNAYTGWFDGAVRATAFNVASTKNIKDNIAEIKIKPDWLDAEDEAKKKYVKDNKATWILNNESTYESLVAELGSVTVTLLDYASMEAGYNAYAEFEWAAGENRNTLIEDVQKQKERVFWKIFDEVKPKSWNPRGLPSITRRGLIVEEVPDQIKGDDKESIDYASVIVHFIKASQSLKSDIVSIYKNQDSILKALQNGTYTPDEIETSLSKINNRLEVMEKLE